MGTMQRFLVGPLPLNNDSPQEKFPRLSFAAEPRVRTFLFNMSHDIRTPMNAIIGFADLAEQSVEDPETARDYISKISLGRSILRWR